MNFYSNSKKINSEILIDVGAYIGFYSIMMGEHFKKYCFWTTFKKFQNFEWKYNKK